MLKRIELLVRELGITITEFEREIGASESSIKNGLRGNSGPRTELYLKIYRRYKSVNLHWLITGEGEMFLKQSEKPLSNVVDDTSSAYQTRLMDVMKDQNASMKDQNEFLKQQVEHWRQQCERWQAEYDKCKGELQSKFR